MVGVPSSQGCKTCRIRKLKCDQEKPNCNRCVRTGRQCGGYEKQVLWKNSFASTPKPSAASNSATTNLVSRTSPSRSSKSPATVISLCVSPNEVRAGPSFQLQFLSLFLTSYMPQGEDNTIPSSGKMPLIVWPHRLPGMVGRSTVVDSAVNAMVTSYLGLIRPDPRLMQESMPLYAIAIRNVYNATMMAHRGVTEDVLTAIMAMAMFEMFLATATGWMSHIQGGAALLQQRGPPTAENPINTDLLRRFRSLSICDCIGRRKRSFFERPEWQKLSGPHPYDDLLDIISSIPGMLEDVDCLITSAITTDNNETLHALNRCLTLEQHMQSWNNALQSSVNNIPLFWQESRLEDSQHPHEDPETEKLFPNRLSFSALRLAQLHQLYWAANMEIYWTMEDLLLNHERIRRLSPKFPSPSSLPSSSSNDSPVGRSIMEISALAIYYADLCCESQDYICSTEHGAVGPQSTMAAMSMVRMFYERHDARKFRWARRELERLAHRGFGAAKLLVTLSREGYSSLAKETVLARRPEVAATRSSNDQSQGVKMHDLTGLPVRGPGKGPGKGSGKGHGRGRGRISAPK